MRTHWLAIAALLMGVAPASFADIKLGAPGVPVGSQKATQVPFKNEVTLSGSYKFVYSGIEAKGNTAGAPGSSGTSGNGGQFHVSAKIAVSGYYLSTTLSHIKEGKLEFRDIQDFNTSPLKQILATPAVTWRAEETPISIKLEWNGQGNAHKPDAMFNILGEYQKAPPVPTGSLNFAVGDWMLLTNGTGEHPDGTVKIVRE